ncbi:cytochrome P450 [Vararia minispora EC-137]|uniref:Cytochrome P450 n=1 Tax=Vararia minispora EC-137 TaxID=1314806 RepID=A0ACB8Q5V8_9AGAM|nr:cytochrome P450 [Vararia minispora EC-137]
MSVNVNNAASDEERFSDDELMIQINIAGSDTTSNALSRILCLLFLHPDVQDKVHGEPAEAGDATGEMTYDDLIGFSYFEAVFRETLQFYPPSTSCNGSA